MYHIRAIRGHVVSTLGFGVVSGFPMRPWHGPLPSLMGSEVWASAILCGSVL